MGSRFVFIIIAIISFSLAVFFNGYFNGLWGWITSLPLVTLVTWPALGFALFSSQKDVDKFTGVDKLEPPNPILLLIELVHFSRYVSYAVTAYLSFIGVQFHIVPLITIAVSLVQTFDIIRLNMLRCAKRGGGVVGILKHYQIFYIKDFIIVSFFYSLGYLFRGA